MEATTILFGLSMVFGVAAAVGYAVEAYRNKYGSGERRRQTAEDRAVDAEIAAQLAEWESIHADYEAVQGLRQHLGGGIIHKLEGMFSPVWAKRGLVLSEPIPADYRLDGWPIRNPNEGAGEEG